MIKASGVSLISTAPITARVNRKFIVSLRSRNRLRKPLRKIGKPAKSSAAS